ncbi:hypothetical protein RHMOL_Rhmol10G0141700 [Rhododendron molle]|uniref:Uncharacterized protein n=2 Tax=Rhododendron molle TaxID=49168 RepID=A0ACC0M335_RHOML|nr:hypothetical protein RHMOL_Rhmol10G0141700 [Rhododendron molle]KAI8535009.1 hypothetical protein RHMOL_Rhmol10G0141700 [Rhododendron molle]
MIRVVVSMAWVEARGLRVKICWDRLIGRLPDRRVCAPRGLISNSSSSKSMGVDSSEARAEAQMGNVTPVQSPSGDVVTALLVLDQLLPHLKKQVLRRSHVLVGVRGWLSMGRRRLMDLMILQPTMMQVIVVEVRTEPLQLQVSNLAGTSPRIGGFSDCASPAMLLGCLQLLTRKIPELSVCRLMSLLTVTGPLLYYAIWFEVRDQNLIHQDSEDEPADPSIIYEEPEEEAPSDRRRYLPQDQKLDPDPIVASFSCGAAGVISSLMILGVNNNIEQQ